MFASGNRSKVDACWDVGLARRFGQLRDEASSLELPVLALDGGRAASDPRSEPASPPPVTLHRDPTATADLEVEIDGLTFRLSGSSILCVCPACRTPMALRLWLMTADCWRCAATVELTEHQARTLARWLPAPRVPISEPPRSRQTEAPAIDWSPPPASAPEPNPSLSPSAVAELEALLQGTTWRRFVQHMLALLSAWLISFLFHLFVILVLAMVVLSHRSNDAIQLVLSTFLDTRREEGGEVRLENPRLAMEDDSLPAPPADESTRERETMEQAERDAAELVSDPSPLAPLPELVDVRRRLTQSQRADATFLARDPRVRAEIVEREGGTTMTEAAVARGLRWLASVQNRDGSWSLANYDLHERANNQGDAAATSLALLPFLGAGQTHEYGMYKQNVARGLEWLISRQQPDGDLRANFNRQAGMYAHGQAAIVLCEIYAMTGDERFRDPAQRAIEFIERAQHRQGGWRYVPGQAGDTSVFGWQLMALQSARASVGNLVVEDDVMILADYYLDLAGEGRGRNPPPDGALYRYLPGEGTPSPSMTAEAMLCRMYLGWRRDDPRLMYATSWLLRNHLPGTAEADIYYWYYATQAMHHLGGESWRLWNEAFRDRLVAMQETDGAHPGSWNPRQFRWGQEGGRIFVTAMAVCTLEVYYRHLPLFRPLDLK